MPSSFKTLVLYGSLLTGLTSVAGLAKCSRGRTARSDTCCVWYDILDDMQENLYSGGECDEVAHDALRLVFHDSIGWSSSLKRQGQFPGGGADGSIIAFSETELGFGSNVGLDDIVEMERPYVAKYGVSYGDIVQFAAAVSVRNCAGGPRLSFKAGRPNPTQAAPDGLVPDPSDSVTKILDRMADAGFSPKELVDLLASHSIGFQEHIDPSIEFTPFDSTVEVMDTQFHLETLLKGNLVPGDGIHNGEAMSPIPGEFRLQSDAAIARDPRTACYWESLILNQPAMAEGFKEAMAKLALVGQQGVRLTDCSEVIPPPTKRAPIFAKLPPGKSFSDIEFSCKHNPFRSPIDKVPGPAVSLLPAFGHKRPNNNNNHRLGSNSGWGFNVNKKNKKTH